MDKRIFWTIFSIILILFAGGLIVEKKVGAIAELDIDSYRFNYKQIINYLKNPDRIVNFSGTMSISEFDDRGDKAYAGHLGFFRAPPFYSKWGVTDWFEDDFERNDIWEEKQWRVKSGQEDDFFLTSNEIGSKSGRKVLEVSGENGLRSIQRGGRYIRRGVFRMAFYDSGDSLSAGTVMSLAQGNFSTVAKYLIVGIPSQGGRYQIRLNNEDIISSQKEREKGWHVLEFEINEDRVIMKIDGQTEEAVTGFRIDGGVNLISVGRNGESTGRSYFDKIEVIEEDGWRKGFNTGLVFYNHQTGQVGYEQPSDLENETDWYPSKMEVRKNYSSGNFLGKITGKKMAIPGRRAFGLKLSFVDYQQDTSVMILSGIPTIKRLEGEGNGWNWKPGNSENGRGVSNWDEGNKAVIFENREERVFMALGLNKTAGSWQIGNYAYPEYGDRLIASFRDDGQLENVAGDEGGVFGSSAGLVYRLQQGSNSDEITLLVTIGESREEVLRDLNELRGKDIEAMSDNFWSQRMKNMWEKMPQLVTGNDLEKYYYNSAMHLLMNKWEGVNVPGGRSNFYSLAGVIGESLASFPWNVVNYSQLLSMTDQEGMKQQIIEYLRDGDRCRALNPIFPNNDLCDVVYSFDRFSIMQTVYDYLTVSGDVGLLEEEIREKDGKWTKKARVILEEMSVYFDNQAGGADKLADFGHDHNIYEFNIHCPENPNEIYRGWGLGGLYTGKVISPNAERYEMHRMMAEIYRMMGGGYESWATRHEESALKVKQALGELWNENKGYYDSISLYNWDMSRRATPLRFTEWMPVAGFHVMDYEGLIDEDKKSRLIGYLKREYIDSSKRFSSLPIGIRNQWCVRSDWHGPGLYSGELGLLMANLFKNGEKDLVYEMFSQNRVELGYSWLKEVPYSVQMISSEIAGLDVEGTTTGYVDNTSIAQGLVKGMFGVRPNMETVIIEPRIPTGLGRAKLNNVRVRGLVFDIEARVGTEKDRLTIRKDGEGSMETVRFDYHPEVKKEVEVIVEDLRRGGDFEVKIKNGEGGAVSSTKARVNSIGILSVVLELENNNTIEISEAEGECKVCLSGIAKERGNSDCDGDVDMADYSNWRAEYLIYRQTGEMRNNWNADFNCDQKVNLFDWNRWKDGYIDLRSN